METSKERHSRGLHDLLLRFRCLLVLLARLETKRTIVQCGSFFDSIFSSFASLVFSFSVSDRVSKSKFLFPFSFSSHEHLPWFVYVWDAPESPLSHGATFKVGDGLTVDRHCFLFCLYFFLYFSRKLTFFSRPFFFLFLFSFWWCFYILLSLSSLSLLSLSYLGICLILRTTPPQFPPPPLFFEICFFVSGGTRWMEEEELAFNP